MIKSSKRQSTDCYLPWPLTQILIISSIISKRSYNSISKCFYDPRKTAYETKNVERGEWILSSLCLPTVHSPLATTASVTSSVADRGSLPVGHHSNRSCVQFLSLITRLFHFLFASSTLVFVRYQPDLATKPASEGVLSFPGAMAKSWKVRSEQETSSWK